MKDIENKIKQTMAERDYELRATTNDTIFHFHTPIEEKPPFIVDVRVIEDKVEFRFRYVTKKLFELSSDWIGCFFDDEHFKKFETNFWNVCCAIYNYEKE